MDNYSLWISFKKGIIPALGSFIVSQLVSIDPGTILSNPKERLPELLLSLAVGAVPAVLNMWKKRDLPGNPFYRAPTTPYPSIILVGLLSIALGVGLGGCATTTDANGVTTTHLDISAIQATYLIYVAEMNRLEAAGAARDIKSEAARQERLAALRSVMQPLSEQLLDAGYTWVRDNSGRWVNVATGNTVTIPPPTQ